MKTSHKLEGSNWNYVYENTPRYTLKIDSKKNQESNLKGTQQI